jgi:ribosome recycling factor
MLQQIYATAKPQMQEAINKLSEGLKTIHTGRASTALVDDIQVSSYGSMMALKQIATVSTPDATLITITPWDKGNLVQIEAAVRDSGRNLNPSNDGNMIRIALPPMSQERREEFVKLASKMAEETRIVLRNVRKNAWEQVQDEEKKGELTEDDKYDGEKDLNKMIDEFNAKVEELISAKEKEIRTI